MLCHSERWRKCYLKEGITSTKKAYLATKWKSHPNRMCDEFCDQFETFNPETEYQKFLKTKPIVNTAKLYENLHVSERMKCPYLFKGYGVEVDENPMYRTVNSEYGYYSPNAYTIPTRNFPLSQKFSNEISKYGMYRNFSLNTQMDKSLF